MLILSNFFFVVVSVVFSSQIDGIMQIKKEGMNDDVESSVKKYRERPPCFRILRIAIEMNITLFDVEKKTLLFVSIGDVSFIFAY